MSIEQHTTSTQLGLAEVLVTDTVAIPPGTRVKYLVDASGQVQRVWILTPEEAQR